MGTARPLVFHMVNVFGGDDFCCGQWWWHCSCTRGSSAPEQGNLLFRGHVFKELNCTGKQQLCDNPPNPCLHEQHQWFSQSSEGLWPLGDKHPITYDSCKPSDFAERTIQFCTQLFNIKVCFGSETGPASRVLLLGCFILLLFIRACSDKKRRNGFKLTQGRVR